jgi:hypothetical protein
MRQPLIGVEQGIKVVASWSSNRSVVLEQYARTAETLGAHVCSKIVGYMLEKLVNRTLRFHVDMLVRHLRIS